MKHLRYTSIAALPLTLLAISGCGGGGGDSTASTTTPTVVAPTLSKQELISQGDAICAEVNAAVGSIGAAETEVPTQITQVSGLYVGMVDSLKRLGEPEEAAGYSEFIAAAEELSKVEGEIKLAAEREDTAALGEAATKSAPVLEEFQSAAAAYGFENCSEGPKAPTAVAGGSTGAAEEGEESGVEAAPEEVEEAPEAVEEEVETLPETGGAGGTPEGGGSEPETGGSSGGIGPG